MTNRIDVLGLGAVAVDFVGTLRNWPAKGAKKPLQSLSIYDGGLVGTAVTAVARLGGSVRFAGKLGNSDMARRAIEALEKEGVDTSFVIRAENAEPVIAFVYIDSADGQRNVFWTRQNVQYPFSSEFPDKNWFDNTAVVLIDHEAGMAGVETAKVAAQHCIPVVVDVEQNEPHVRQLFTFSSHIVVSEDFAADYTGKTDVQQMLEALKISPDQTIIITCGKNGCAGLAADGLFELPAFKVDVLDTTGCGDVFHGAYALAIARGQTAIEAAHFASAAAALCATKVGGRDGIPTVHKLHSFIQNQVSHGG
ncbi:MAG: PfkB family carbohydrate kinase [Planctomycetota bacterium]